MHFGPTLKLFGQIRKQRFAKALSRRVLGLVIGLCCVPQAIAQRTSSYVDLHDFGGQITVSNGATATDGVDAWANVIIDSSGNRYGTCPYGGPNDEGMVWEITAAGKYKDLHDFGGTITNANGKRGPDGMQPFGCVATDQKGNLYGTATMGGANKNGGGGIVWELTTSGSYIDLHDFGASVITSNGQVGPDGTLPWGPVTLDGSGNLYGTASDGGGFSATTPFGGMVWEITVSGTYLDLHDFGGLVTNSRGKSVQDGAFPHAGVSFDGKGNMFGTASSGGASLASDGGG